MLSVKLEIENALKDQALYGYDVYRKQFQSTFNQTEKTHKSKVLKNLKYKFYTDIEELLDDTAAIDATNIEQVMLVLNPEQYFRGKIYRKSIDSYVDIKSLIFSTKTSSIYMLVDKNNQGLIITDNVISKGIKIDNSTLNIIIVEDGTSTDTGSQIYIDNLNNVDYTTISINEYTLKVIDSDGREYIVDLTEETTLTLYKNVIIKKIPIFVIPYIETVNEANLSLLKYVLVVDFDANKLIDITSSENEIIKVNFSDIAKDLSDLIKLYYVPEKAGSYYQLEITNTLTPLKTKAFIIYRNTQAVMNSSTILNRYKHIFDVKVAKILSGYC